MFIASKSNVHQKHVNRNSSSRCPNKTSTVLSKFQLGIHLRPALQRKRLFYLQKTMLKQWNKSVQLSFCHLWSYCPNFMLILPKFVILKCWLWYVSSSCIVFNIIFLIFQLILLLSCFHMILSFTESHSMPYWGWLQLEASPSGFQRTVSKENFKKASRQET